MNTTTHNLIFKSDSGGTREIAAIRDSSDSGERKTDSEILNEVNKIIKRFCDNRNFEIYYIRIWNEDGATVFDVGSHTEFFRLIPELDMNAL